jgi:hypothetical protein
MLLFVAAPGTGVITAAFETPDTAVIPMAAAEAKTIIHFRSMGSLLGWDTPELQKPKHIEMNAA